MSSDHEKMGKVVPGRTMQLDALPEELVEGYLDASEGGYQLADEADAEPAGPSLPPPLPPGGSIPAPGAAPATVPPRQSKRTVVIAVVVALLMAVAGIAVGMMVLGDDEPAPAEPPPSIELGDIEVQSH